MMVAPRWGAGYPMRPPRANSTPRQRPSVERFRAFGRGPAAVKSDLLTLVTPHRRLRAFDPTQAGSFPTNAIRGEASLSPPASIPKPSNTRRNGLLQIGHGASGCCRQPRSQLGPVRELDEFQGVYRCAPFFLRPLQRKHQLLGAGSTAARQNHPADGKRDPDDHPDRSEVYETEHKANKHCRSDDRARLSGQHEPSAALDRFSEFLNTNLKSLDLLHGRESEFKARSPLQRDTQIAGP